MSVKFYENIDDDLLLLYHEQMANGFFVSIKTGVL